MSNRSLNNPLALPVLALLLRRPMHPYEIAAEMRRLHWHGTVKLTVGSLYTVVEALQRAGFIAAQETTREGRRPERTVYALSDAGRSELFARLRALLRDPVPEYSRFGAGLMLIALLPRAEIVALLRDRVCHLEAELAAARTDLQSHRDQGLPRLLSLDAEYALTLREAESSWLQQLLRELEGGALTWPGLRAASPHAAPWCQPPNPDDRDGVGSAEVSE